jgi:hypothetical protein
MSLLDAIVSNAEARGYLPLRPDTRWLRDAPAWLEDIQRPGGIERLESRLGFAVPVVVREFWGNPSFVRLLDSWRWQNYLDEEPSDVTWNCLSFLLVCSHPHSGLIGAVQLNAGADPLLDWGWEDETSPVQQSDERFSEHLRLAVQRGPGE